MAQRQMMFHSNKHKYLSYTLLLTTSPIALFFPASHKSFNCSTVPPLPFLSSFLSLHTLFCWSDVATALQFLFGEVT
jgi:hypothetical protein